MEAVPEHGSCLVCGSENPDSFGMQWFTTEPGATTGKIILTERQQGPPNYAHGGASAALLDEVMGMAVWSAGHPVVAADLKVNFHKPVPLGEEIEVRGQITVVEEGGKVVHAVSEIRLADGQVAASGEGLYVKAPRFFGDFFGFPNNNLET